MVVMKCSDALEVPRVKLYVLLCGRLYKECGGGIVTWSGTYPYSKMNCFNCYRKDNDWVITEE